MPTFMAKPHFNLPGCSGHIHVSLSAIADAVAKGNLFDPAVEKASGYVKGDFSAENVEVTHLSQVMKWFLAGVLEGLPSVMACFAPTINRFFFSFRL